MKAALPQKIQLNYFALKAFQFWRPSSSDLQKCICLNQPFSLNQSAAS